MKTKAFFLFLFALLLNFSCNSIEPPANGNGIDTTSHNFTFETWTFGEHSSSVLYDVAIITENNIWAVGEIYMKDSLGQSDPDAYNAIHWDGNGWSLKRIRYYGACSAVEYPPLKAIWTFSEDNIVLTNGGSIGWFNGQNVNLDCDVNPLLNGAINKIWGSSLDNIYAVGDQGTIIHYHNNNWVSLFTATDLDIYDIWGSFNNQKNEYEIIVVAAKQFVSYDKKIFKVIENTVENINVDSIPFSIHGLWFKGGHKYYISGSGLYSKNNIYSTTKWEWLHPDVTNYYLYAISGQDINDLFACGAFGEIIHYNGNNWKSFREITKLTNGAYYNIDIKDNLIVAAGYDNQVAIVTIGNR